ncbi:YadA-like family protein [Halomonas sp. EF61]|uniref:beta strand repeat-containing protein n=1 Tax=Halomonas sp. EF61 TaxID=2950869 RepID=UPI0032DF1B87
MKRRHLAPPVAHRHPLAQAIGSAGRVLAGGALVSSLGLIAWLGAPTTAQADYILTDGSCVGATQANDAYVGREPVNRVTQQATDGNGNYSTVAGCNANQGGAANFAVTAFGAFTTTGGDGALALGFKASATARFASAVGLDTVADAMGATALGFGSNAKGVNAVAIGGASDGTTDGAGSAAGGTLSLANSTTASGAGSIAIGSNTVKGAQATGIGTIALGGESSASGEQAIALGEGSNASGKLGTALGVDTVASGENSVALGSLASASAKDTLALGEGSAATQDGALALGHESQSKGIDSIAIGSAAKASGKQSISLGYGNTVSGDFSGAFGDPSEVSGDQSYSVGNNNTIKAELSGVFGSGSSIDSGADGSYVLGNSSSVTAAGGLALGNDAAVSAAQGIAIGSGASASVADSVALGSRAATETVVATTQASIAGKDYSFAGATPSGTLSLGAAATTDSEGNAVASVERTITHVAAGRLSATSTDAVNGSQLHATNQAVDLARTDIDALDTRVTSNSDNITTNTTSIAGNTTAISTNTSAIATNTSDIAGLQGGVSSLQQGAVTFKDNGDGTFDSGTIVLDEEGTTITNLADGSLAEDSQEAVNGGQLFATNQKVTGNTTAINDLTTVMADTTSTLTNLSGDVADNTTAITNLSQGVTDNGTAITNLTTSVGGNTTRLDALAEDATYYQANSSAAGATASGAESLSMGPQSTASAANSVAIGNGANSSVAGGVALGAGSVASRAVVADSGSIAAGSATISYNTSDKTLLGAVSVGNDGGYRQIIKVADGVEAHDAVTLRQLQGAMVSLSTAGGNRYFHANSTNAADSLAGGDQSVAVGPATVVNGDHGLGIGDGAEVEMTAPGGIALGQHSHSFLEDTIAIGTESQAQGQLSLALGAGATSLGASSVALGSNSVADEAVATGGMTLLGQDYVFAGGTPVATVGIGSQGQERTLTHLAAGRVSADSTDAVNGSQLYATGQAVEGVGARVDELETGLGGVTERVDGLDSRVDGLEGQYANLADDTVSYDPDSEHGSITLGGSGGTTITNLADGDIQQGSSDAVTGGQLWDLSQKVDSLGSGGNGGSGGGGIYTDIATSGPAASVATDEGVAIGGGARVEEGAEGGVALGSGSVADREGMNGQNEAFSNTTVASNQGALSVGSAGGERQITNVAGGTEATDAVNVRQLEAVQQGAANYDRHEDGSIDYASLTFGNGEGPTQLHNVAPGTSEYDAVNVGQLNALDQKYSSAYDHLDDKIDDLEEDISAGIASAVAMGSAPYMAGLYTYYVGVGYHDGESAVGVNLRRTADNGRWSVSAGFAGSRVGMTAGLGVSTTF